VAALQGYLSRKYGKQFRSFIGASIEVNGSPKFADTKVEWHVVEQNGKLRFFDMYVAGVKLITTERNEVRALLDRQGGSLGKLAQALNGLG